MSLFGDSKRYNCKCQSDHFQMHKNNQQVEELFYLITMTSQWARFFYSDADQRKHQSSGSLAFVRGSHRGPLNSLHKWPVTRKMFPFDDVIMLQVTYFIFVCVKGRTAVIYNTVATSLNI